LGNKLEDKRITGVKVIASDTLKAGDSLEFDLK